MTLEYNDLLVSFCLLQLIRHMGLLWRPPERVHPPVAWKNLGRAACYLVRSTDSLEVIHQASAFVIASLLIRLYNVMQYNYQEFTL